MQDSLSLSANIFDYDEVLRLIGYGVLRLIWKEDKMALFKKQKFWMGTQKYLTMMKV